MNAVDQIRKIFAFGMSIFELRWSQFVDLYGTEIFKMLGRGIVILPFYIISRKNKQIFPKFFPYPKWLKCIDVDDVF